MHVLLELLVVSARVALSFAVAALRWLRPRAPKSVRDEVCLVTGAARGLGRLFALELATRGVDALVLWDVDGEGNEETAALARRAAADAGVACPRVLAYTCDVSKRVDVYRVAGLVRRDAGDVTLLVSNAGVVSGHPLLDCPDELLERTMAVNLHALFWITKAFLPAMLEKNHGHMVTIASSLGLFSTAGIEDYCASKFGAVGFHESLSHEIKAMERDGVKTTLVCPYLVQTGMFHGCRIRKEVETYVLPPLQPEQCVQQAMRAILTDQPVLCMPRLIYLVVFMKSILPWEAVVAMYRFLGADKCMYPFFEECKRRTNNNQEL
ncbi:unnamed protein product [Lampetra fluviatilis]